MDCVANEQELRIEAVVDNREANGQEQRERPVDVTDDTSERQVVDMQIAAFAPEVWPEDSDGVLKEEANDILKSINLDETNRVEHLMSRKFLEFAEGFPKLEDDLAHSIRSKWVRRNYYALLREYVSERDTGNLYLFTPEIDPSSLSIPERVVATTLLDRIQHPSLGTAVTDHVNTRFAESGYRAP